MNGIEGRLAELLIPYLRDELEPLEAQWVEARIARSTALRDRVAQLRSAFDIARSHAPELAPEDRARLLARIEAAQPASADSRSAGPLRWLALGFAATALAVMGVVLAQGGDRPVEIAETIDFTGDELEGLTVEAERNEVGPNLRTVVSRNWVGRVDGGEKDTHVRVDRGTIAFGFRGGEGRRLEVTTDHARVVVVGTRFSVQSDASATTVEVSQGTVEVWRGRKKIELTAGMRARITERGAKVRRVEPAGILDDPYLVAITGEYRASRASARRPRTKRADTRPFDSGLRPGSGRTSASPDPDPINSQVRPFDGLRTQPEPDPSGSESQGRLEVDLEAALAALERADALARTGDLKAARNAYEAVMTEAGPSRIRRMARLGRARVLGRQGQLRESLSELAVLAQVEGEVGWQARLSRCEVQRRFQPCSAQRCFGALADDPDQQLANEAARLYERSRGSGLRCEGPK